MKKTIHRNGIDSPKIYLFKGTPCIEQTLFSFSCFYLIKGTVNQPCLVSPVFYLVKGTVNQPCLVSPVIYLIKGTVNQPCLVSPVIYLSPHYISPPVSHIPLLN